MDRIFQLKAIQLHHANFESIKEFLSIDATLDKVKIRKSFFTHDDPDEVTKMLDGIQPQFISKLKSRSKHSQFFETTFGFEMSLKN